MSPIVPSLPPHLVQLGFDYVLAAAIGDDATAARLAPEVEQLPGLLPAIAELIVFPVTALSDDTEPCADSFVLDEVGVSASFATAARSTCARIPSAPCRMPIRRAAPSIWAAALRCSTCASPPPFAGWAAATELLPDSVDPQLLASVRLTGPAGDDDGLAPCTPPSHQP